MPERVNLEEHEMLVQRSFWPRLLWTVSSISLALALLLFVCALTLATLHPSSEILAGVIAGLAQLLLGVGVVSLLAFSVFVYLAWLEKAILEEMLLRRAQLRQQLWEDQVSQASAPDSTPLSTPESHGISRRVCKDGGPSLVRRVRRRRTCGYRRAAIQCGRRKQ